MYQLLLEGKSSDKRGMTMPQLRSYIRGRGVGDSGYLVEVVKPGTFQLASTNQRLLQVIKTKSGPDFYSDPVHDTASVPRRVRVNPRR